MEKRSSSESREPLIDQDLFVLNQSADTQGERVRNSRITLVHAVIVSLLIYIAAVLTISNLTISAKVPLCSEKAKDSSSAKSILPQDIIEYEERHEWSHPKHPWNLGPSDELDAAWDDLLYALNIRIKPAELDRLGENKTNRVRVNNGDYLGALGVFHHLHCLNNLRRVLHWDYYGPRLAHTTHPEGFEDGHSDHCIESIRQALLCHANTILYTTEWEEPNKPKSRISKELRTGAKMKCVKWDPIKNWVRERALVPGEFYYIRKPLKAQGDEIA